MPRIPHLKRARERALLTQEALAKKSGVAEVTIARAETGHGVQLSTIRRLAEALNIEATVLMGDGEPEGKEAA
jgi:transcriptional regulator with XRE-family HTH domain